MARTVPRHWLTQLRAVSPGADLRWNEEVYRWEFLIRDATGQLRSQFYGRFHDTNTGQKLKPDPQTGMFPFRELDDEGLREVCRNLTESAVWNRHDGAGTTRKQVVQNLLHNRTIEDQRKDSIRALIQDALDFGPRWAPQFAVTRDVTPALTGASPDPE